MSTSITPEVREAIEEAERCFVMIKFVTPPSPPLGWPEAAQAVDALVAVRQGSRAAREGIAFATEKVEQAATKNTIWGTFQSRVYDVVVAFLGS